MKNSQASNMISVVRRLLAFCGFLYYPIAGYSQIDETLPDDIPAPSAMQIADLGEHWSGLDREALFEELSLGELRAASSRIVAAAEGSERDNAEHHILAELLTTDLFREHREALRQICKERLDGAERARPKGLAEDKWNSRLLARSMLYERILHDRQSAEKGYREILKAKLGKGRRAKDLASEDDEGLTPEEKAAARQLARLEARRGEQ